MHLVDVTPKTLQRGRWSSMQRVVPVPSSSRRSNLTKLRYNQWSNLYCTI